MRVLLIIVALLVVIQCERHGLIVGRGHQCGYEEARFDRLFSACMGGKNVAVSSSDPDDFVSECRVTAEKHANSLCFWYCDDYQAGYDVASISHYNCDTATRGCASAETQKQKDACHWYGYRQLK